MRKTYVITIERDEHGNIIEEKESCIVRMKFYGKKR